MSVMFVRMVKTAGNGREFRAIMENGKIPKTEKAAQWLPFLETEALDRLFFHDPDFDLA